MACNPDFVQYIIDQCSGAGEIAVKKMMGDYCAYCNGILFGLICDNGFYVKVTAPYALHDFYVTFRCKILRGEGFMEKVFVHET